MKRTWFSFVVVVVACVVGGCATAPKTEPPRVETSWVGQARGKPALAAQVLEGQEFGIGRAEKAIIGPVVVGEVSAYTDWTYDWQQIGTYPGWGTRYRSVVRSGVSFP